MKKTAVLLVNLGTPDSPSPSDVYRYLIEFLTDGRVIDSPWLWRQLLVRGIIVPSRYKQSAASYKEIWTEQGSPLLYYGKQVEALVQERLGDHFIVKLAMRYQNPSIKNALEELTNQPIDQLIVFPLFPQYASATTGSVHEKIMQLVSRLPIIPRLTFIDHYADHPALIAAFVDVAKPFIEEGFDHLLFSFHGLPQRHLTKADRQQWCLQSKDCCQQYCSRNQSCYSSQCYATARAIVRAFDLTPDQYSICFQSRLGKEPWLQPYTSERIKELAKEGKKHVLVACPSFVCDCLETTYEIGTEYAAEFCAAGGESLRLIPGLNENSVWIESLAQMILEHCSSKRAATLSCSAV